MKTKRFLITSALLLVSAYSVYTILRVQQLETRLREQNVRASTPQINPQITYAFDDSFRRYFGEAGVSAVEQALQMLQNPKAEQAPKFEQGQMDLFTDGLRLDSGKE